MRNTACHHIIEKEEKQGNIITRNNIQELFINMVKLYKACGLELIKEFVEIRNLWDKIHEELCEQPKAKKRKIANKNIDENQIDNNIFEKVKEHQEFYDYSKDLLQFLHKNGSGNVIFPSYRETKKTRIKLIYRYVAPIIVWYHNVKKKFRNGNINCFLFKICHFTRTVACHLTKYVSDEEDLKQLIVNICIVYLGFGIDLYKEEINVRDLLENEPTQCKYVNDVKKLIELQKKDEIEKKYVIDEIKNILSGNNKNYNQIIDEYLFFGQLLHYFVSTKIKSGDMITQVFLQNNDNIEWCDVDNRFILKDSEQNLKRKSIIKLASPVFVWIEIVNKLELTEYEKRINTLGQMLINYLVKNKDDEEDSILEKMKSLYKPIKQWFNTDETLHNYPKSHCSDIFNKLVKHSVIGRKKRRFSYSFIFNYYYKQNMVTDEMEYTGKMFDIFNFCGLFYILIKYFENGADTSFYKKVKEITDLISDYMQQEIENTREIKVYLQNKIIDEIKSIFPELTRLIEEYMKQEKQNAPENNIDVQNEIIKEMILVFPQSIYEITNYMIKKILNKDKFDEKSIKKLNGKIKSIFCEIVDQLIQLANKDKSDSEKIIIIDENKLKFPEIADQITNDMMPKLQKTIDILSDQQNKIIDKMKYLLPDCDEFKSSYYQDVPAIFHTIYSYVVKSRPNVEISF